MVMNKVYPTLRPPDKSHPHIPGSHPLDTRHNVR